MPLLPNMRPSCSSALWTVIWLLLQSFAAAQNAPVYPTNTSTQNFSNASQPVLLRLSDIINLGSQPPMIHALTPQSFTDLPVNNYIPRFEPRMQED